MLMYAFAKIYPFKTPFSISYEKLRMKAQTMNMQVKKIQHALDEKLRRQNWRLSCDGIPY